LCALFFCVTHTTKIINFNEGLLTEVTITSSDGCTYQRFYINPDKLKSIIIAILKCLKIVMK